MKLKSSFFILSFLSAAVFAGPVLQMNRAFMALADLIPFLTDEESFQDRKNATVIRGKISELQTAFKDAKHDRVLKEDLFAPSYAIINESISASFDAFKAGKKDYAHWRLKEITTHCLDCHTRLPPSFESSFQNGELTINEKKFDNVYNLGIAQLIVRRYVDAKNSFIRSIQDRMIRKDYREIMPPFKQILVIHTKVLKTPEDLIALFKEYAEKKGLPEEVKNSLLAWIGRLNHWKGQKVLSTGLEDDQAVEAFITRELSPLKKKTALDDGNDVDLLIATGVLSNYLFENPSSKKAPEISFWLGWSEKHLKREAFFGSGDLFLKQCVKRYPKDPIARKCLDEYRESVEFEFTGSSGTRIPSDVRNELNSLEQLIQKR